jgi:hypothetical protein
MKILITERQSKLLMENLPPGIRRRYNYNTIKDHLDFTVIESISPCDYFGSSYFITEMCDMITNDLIEDFEDETQQILTSKVKDDMYYFIADNFADYLQDIYDKQCQ